MPEQVVLEPDLRTHLESYLAWAATSIAGDNVLVSLMGHWSPPRAGSGARSAFPDLIVGEGGPGLAARGLAEAIARGLPERGADTTAIALEVCYGAIADVAWDLRDVADWLVATPSALNSPGYPWREILRGLDSEAADDPGGFAQVVGAALERAVRGEQGSPSAVSVIHLRAMDVVAEALRSLTAAALGDISSAAAAAQWLRSRSTDDGWSRELCDARKLSDALEAHGRTQELQVASRAFSASLSELVVVRSGGGGVGGDGTGVTLFLPGALSRTVAGYRRSSDFADRTGYGAFVEAYLAHCGSLVPGLGS